MAQEVSIPRQRLADGSLPPICLICGNAAPHRRFAKIGAPSLAWIFVAPLIGLLAFWISVLPRDPPPTPNTPSPGIPFCDRHRNYWPRRGWFITLGFACILVMFVLTGIIAANHDKLGDFDFVLSITGCSLPLFLIAFLIIHLSSIRPTGANATAVTFTGAHDTFARALKQPAPPG